jgi:hypothetical protein
MTLGIGNIVALICIVISIIFAIVTNQATNALWWALLAIFAVLRWGAGHLGVTPSRFPEHGAGEFGFVFNQPWSHGWPGPAPFLPCNAKA